MDGSRDGDDAVIGGGGDADAGWHVGRRMQTRACAMKAVVGEVKWVAGF